MIPLSYQGASVAGKVANDTVRYYGGYVNKMKQINDTDFKQLAEAAFLPGESNGMWYGGAQWKVNNNVMLQGGYNRADNLLDMGWVDLDMVHRFDKDRYVRLDVQYLYETANGSKNLGDFTMNNKAAYLEGAGGRGGYRMPRSDGTSDGDESALAVQPRAVIPGAAHR
jgi:hypothetical protein